MRVSPAQIAEKPSELGVVLAGSRWLLYNNVALVDATGPVRASTGASRFCAVVETGAEPCADRSEDRRDAFCDTEGIRTLVLRSVLSACRGRGGGLRLPLVYRRLGRLLSNG